MERTPPSVAAALLAEHRSLLAGIQELGRVADESVAASPEAIAAGIAESHRFLLERLIPHAAAEDDVLYPAVDRALGAPGATLTMSLDHRAVERYARELGRLAAESPQRRSAAWAASVRRVLYGLHAVLELHMAKEEEVYFPVLDSALTREQADRLFEEMERAAGKRRQAAQL